MVQVDGDGDEGREMKDVVRDDIEASAERGREELEPGDFTSQPSRMQLAQSKRAPSNAAHGVVLASSATPPSPMRRLTAVITFGVTGVRINTRESATDRTRSNRAR